MLCGEGGSRGSTEMDSGCAVEVDSGCSMEVDSGCAVEVDSGCTVEEDSGCAVEEDSGCAVAVDSGGSGEIRLEGFSEVGSGVSGKDGLGSSGVVRLCRTGTHSSPLFAAAQAPPLPEHPHPDGVWVQPSSPLPGYPGDCRTSQWAESGGKPRATTTFPSFWPFLPPEAGTQGPPRAGQGFSTGPCSPNPLLSSDTGSC